MLEFFRYLFVKNSFQRLCESLMRDQRNFMLWASLKSWQLLRPRPPRDFGVQIDLQDFGVNPFVDFLSKPYQNFLNMLSLWVATVFGILRVAIVYEGIEVATDLMRVVLLVWDKTFVFHPCTLFSNFFNGFLEDVFFLGPNEEWKA